MRGTTFFIPFLVALNVFAAEYPAGELLPLLEPKVVKSSLTNRDLGLFIPTHRSSPGLTLGFSPKRNGLTIRQSCGDPRYEVCPSKDFCCPIDALCCAATKTCCEEGFKCCPAGECCPSTHNCVNLDGQDGCCPIGKTCSAHGNECADPGYDKCAGENYCCKPGDTCYRDADNQPKCGDGGDATTKVTTIRSTNVFTYPISVPATTSKTRVNEPDLTTKDDQNQDITTDKTVGGGAPTTMGGPFTTASLPSSSSSSPARAAAATVTPSGNTGLGNTILGNTSGASSAGCSLRMTLTALIIGIAGTFALA